MKSDQNAGPEKKAGDQAAMGMDRGKKSGQAAVAELGRQHPKVATAPGSKVLPTRVRDSGNIRNKGFPK